VTAAAAVTATFRKGVRQQTCRSYCDLLCAMKTSFCRLLHVLLLHSNRPHTCSQQ
jgi:hypothetical protein